MLKQINYWIYFQWQNGRHTKSH